MTDFSKLSDDEINQRIHLTPMVTNGHLWPAVKYVECGGWCFKLLKHMRADAHSLNMTKDDIWTVYAFDKHGDEHAATNTNLNRAILECYLQTNEAEQ